MAKIFKYAFFTSTVAYFLAAVLIAIIFIILFNTSRSGDLAMETLLTGVLVGWLTLGLSLVEWFWDFYGLAVLVPWFGSTVVLVLLLRLFGGGAKRRWLWGGVSLGVYYLAMFFVLVTGLISSNGDENYFPLLIWPPVGFILGGLAAFIVDKIMKPEFDV